jgi:large subunit ribosomal protein L5
MARLREHFFSTVAPKMMEDFGYKNRLQVPRVEKIVLNMGVGDGARDRAVLDEAASHLATIRDFRGLPDTADGRGNYNMGIEEIIIFPEINLDKVKRSFGMHLSMVTTAKTDAEGKRLLELMGLPFRRR